MTEEISSAAYETAVGGQVAGYQIEAEIGRGGMATVYRALDVKLGRPVALKILAPRLAEDESFRRRFIHESRAAAAVDHPHIVPVFEAGESGGILFIAMRYVGTGDVRRLLERQGRLPVGRVVAITTQAASAIDAAHVRGLVHRDIKPANMLLAETADGRADHVYLSDFGLSKDSLAPSGLTSTGQFMGTLDYVAPEQIEGRAVDGRADQYALACTTVEMLTGAPPFRRDENLALMWAQLSEPPPLLSERRPDLPPAIDQVISRALAKSPAGRYRSCMEFAVALQAACMAQPGGPGGAGGRGPGGRGPERARRPRTEAAYLPPAPASPRPQGAAPASPDSRRAAAPDPADWANLYAPASGPAATAVQPTASRRPPARRRGPAGLAAAAAVIVVLGLAFLGYKLLDHHGTVGAQADAPALGAGGAVMPARTVAEYFRAINEHHYVRAWRLGGRDQNRSFASFVAGFAGTAHDAVRILSVSGGDTVNIRLTATQTDGTVKTYQGSYTVIHGEITHSAIQQTS